MNQIDKIAGIGRTITLKGKEYKLSPLTIGDYGEISAYAKAQRLKIFELANPLLSNQEKINIIQAVPTSEEINSAMTDISGMAFQLWLQLRHYNTMITLQAATSLIDKDNYEDIVRILTEINLDTEKKMEDQPKVVL